MERRSASMEQRGAGMEQRSALLSQKSAATPVAPSVCRSSGPTYEVIVLRNCF
jgi:hypothetical protein